MSLLRLLGVALLCVLATSASAQNGRRGTPKLDLSIDAPEAGAVVGDPGAIAWRASTPGSVRRNDWTISGLMFSSVEVAATAGRPVRAASRSAR